MTIESNQSFEVDEPHDCDTKSKYVSIAPLHQAWTLVRNIPKQKLASLVKEGHVIWRGVFTEKEDKRLEKNWRRFCRHYPQFNDPSLALGLCHRPSVNDNRCNLVRGTVSKKTRKQLKKLKVIHRLAYKLDKRLICDIYFRCKKLIAYKQFAYTSKVGLPEEKVEAVVMKIFDEHEKNWEVSSKLNISPPVVAGVKNRPIKIAPFFWKKEDDLMLEMAIDKQTGDKDPKEVPTHLIDWKEVEREMTNHGYILVASQLYKRWHRINSAMVGLKNRNRRMIELEEVEN